MDQAVGPQPALCIFQNLVNFCTFIAVFLSVGSEPLEAPISWNQEPGGWERGRQLPEMLSLLLFIPSELWRLNPSLRVTAMCCCSSEENKMQKREFSSSRRSIPLILSTKIQDFYFVGSFFPNITEFGQENEISDSPCGFSDSWKQTF